MREKRTEGKEGGREREGEGGRGRERKEKTKGKEYDKGEIY